MVLRILLVATVIAAALVVVQQQRVLENAGLIGYCTRIATPAGKTGDWHECRPGKLTGTPQLSLSSCTHAGHSIEGDLWRCPTPLETDRARQ